MKVRKYIELFWLKIAIYILIKRNGKRCDYISREDNNSLWYLGEKVEIISNHIKSEYVFQGGLKDPVKNIEKLKIQEKE
jgi:hypothetical protein